MNIQVSNFEGNAETVTINEKPDTCPYCQVKVDPSFVTGLKPITDYSGYEKLELVFKCTNKDCRSLFLTYYETLGLRGNSTFMLRGSGKGGYKKVVEFSDIIHKISKKFPIIYNQSYYAEESGYKEICGPGYRRALEFLIKDYLITSDASSKDEVEKEFLGVSIKRISDQGIKDCAERAAWLGNDETHYVRKHTDKDIEDLKELISMTVHWIELVEKTAKYKKNMSSK